MKYAKVIATILLTTIAVGASAQRVVRYNGTTATTSSSSADGWSRIYLNYNPTWVILNEGDLDENYVNNFAFGYAKAIPLVGDLYLEPGGEFQWYFKKHEAELYDTHFNMLSLRIPVNAVYDLDLGGITLRPYAGFYGRFNMLAKEKYEGQGHTSRQNLFKLKDGNNNRIYKHFQIGMQFGGTVVLANKYTAGFGYGFDFNPLTKVKAGGKVYKQKYSQLSLSAGLLF